MHTRQPLPPADQIAKLPPDGGPEFNRLVFSSSPYLRQHARNPVDWHEWGEEAFALARREDKPIFLSVGYSACHWCHVMEHESFEDAKVAELMNKLFVNVKVDREERPDVDQIYMSATQALTGRGGWPNSVFLDHDKRPFFAGTYFPKEDRGPQPGFVSVLYRIAEVWRADKPLIGRTAAQVAEEVTRLSSMTAAVARVTLDTNVLTRALAAHREEFDAVHGGFGGAPKFPPHTTLGLLLARQEAGRDPALDDLITTTLDAMARGGIHDHVGGGFHRYATDAVWFLPHFEKMLYDNAQLARIYARAEALYPGRGYRAVACDTIDWCLRELRHSQGGFFSAYDADSEGEEGKYYLWRLAEVKALLGEEKGAAFAAVYQISAAGNYHEEATGTRTPDNIPHLRGPAPEDQADALRLLREARAKRVKPGLDDKVLLGWNGLMVGALATAGQVLNRPDYVAEAKTTAAFLLKNLRKDGQWQRSWREGDARIPAYLDDVACLAAGLLDLHEATGEKAWLDEAVSVLAEADVRFADKAGGGYYLSGHHHEAMIARGKEPFDNATPAPNGILAQAFARLERLTADPGWTRKADTQLAAFSGLMSRVPTAMSSYLEAALLRPAGELNPATVRAPRVALAARLMGNGDSASARLHLRVEPGWHINANPASRPHLIPLRVRVAGREETPFIMYPAGQALSLGEGAAKETLSVHEGLVSVTVPLGNNTGDGLALEVEFQACDDHACDLTRTVRVPVLGREGARAP